MGWSIINAAIGSVLRLVPGNRDTERINFNNEVLISSDGLNDDADQITLRDFLRFELAELFMLMVEFCILIGWNYDYAWMNWMVSRLFSIQHITVAIEKHCSHIHPRMKVDVRNG